MSLRTALPLVIAAGVLVCGLVLIMVFSSGAEVVIGRFTTSKFELGDNATATLHKGDAVIVIGREHTSSWGPEGSKTHGRVIEADSIGVDLSRAVAEIRRVTRDDDGQ